ncbi:8595_t:CDS:2, partial [Scutellospora calospora]
MSNSNEHVKANVDNNLATQNDLDITKKQTVKLEIMSLNEEYKSFKKNIKNRRHLCAAHIILALIAVFLGQLLTWAEKTKMTGSIGPLISSIIVVTGSIITIVTTLLNRFSNKELEKGYSTQVTDKVFRPMYIHIPDEILLKIHQHLKKLEMESKKDPYIYYKKYLYRKNVCLSREKVTGVDRGLRHSLMILGEIWIGFNILSTSFDLLDFIKTRELYENNFYVQRFERILGYLLFLINIPLIPYHLFVGRIRFEGLNPRFKLLKLPLCDEENLKNLLNGNFEDIANIEISKDKDPENFPTEQYQQ